MNIWWYIVVVKVMHIHEIFVAKDDDHKSLLFLVFFWVTPYSFQRYFALEIYRKGGFQVIIFLKMFILKVGGFTNTTKFQPKE